MKKSIAHKSGMNVLGTELFSDGLVPWSDAIPPKLTGKEKTERTVGILRGCSYCGSMHPSDVVEAIKAGATFEWANMKYGWPHKIYLNDIPNPFAGMLEARSGANYKPDDKPDWIKVGKNSWREPGSPAPDKTYGKFYTVHLLDASSDERKVIEKFLGLSFEFSDDGMVRWRKIE